MSSFNISILFIRIFFFLKGASEIVIKKCTFIYDKDGILLRFTEEEQDKLIQNIIEPMASDGLRTICIAYKDYVKSKLNSPNQVQIQNEPDWDDEDSIVSRLTLLAIVGIEDPVRPEVCHHQPSSFFMI